MRSKVEIVSIDLLKPLEKVFPQHLRNLGKMLLDAEVMTTPIIVDSNTQLVLDGSHRYAFLLQAGYQKAPVIYVDYQNEHIRVGSHLMHRHIIDHVTTVSKKNVVERGVSGQLFLPRTTRHFFPFRKNIEANIPLIDLEKGESLDISYLIHNASIQDEINHNETYLEEIEFEIDEIIQYLDEIRLTKAYLKHQVKEMKLL